MPADTKKKNKLRSEVRLPPAALRRITNVPDRAERVIQFIECLIVPSGVGAGGNFILRDWQRDFIRAIYEPHSLANTRLVRRAILSVARKNGKTALIAGLVLAHLIGPECEQNGEIYSAANDRDQAAIVFKVCAQMVRADPELSVHLKIVDSTKTIAHYASGSVYRAISAEAGTKHGLNPTMVIYDELAQAKSRDLYDVLDTSMGARVEPLFIVISTQSNDPEHILSKLIDDGLSGQDPAIVCHLYAVPDDTVDIYNEDEWKKANPALGDFRDLEDFRTVAGKAARMPAEEPKFRNFYLNQRVSPATSLISRREWMACQGVATINEGESVYLALDLSSVNDLSALAMISDGDNSRVKVWQWKPEDLLAEHSDRDFGHGNHRFVQWRDEGHLETSPGKVIDHIVIAKKIAWIVERFNVVAMAYDRHKIEYLLKDFGRIGLDAYKESDKGDGLKLVPWGQGYVSMSPAIDAFELAITQRELVHNNNPLLNWNIANAVATMDPAGNRKLDKEKARFRIDGAVALVMALGLKARDYADNSMGDFLKNAVMT